MRSSLKPYWILVAAEPVTDVDTTAAEMLFGLDEGLNDGEIHLVFVELKDPVKEKIVRYGLLETIDYRHFYPTLETAVAAFHTKRKKMAIEIGLGHEGYILVYLAYFCSFKILYADWTSFL